MEPTYRKRMGTTNRSDTDDENNGHEYEKWNIVNIVLNLLTNDEISNFYVSLNNDEFTVCNFDDIVIEIKENNNQKTYALQLKYRNKQNACLSIDQFGELDGNFNITQHVIAFHKLKTIVSGIILYTNQKVQTNNTCQFKLKDPNVDIYINRINKKKSNYLAKILGKHILYKFRMNVKNNQDASILPYRIFLDTFFLLTKKEDLDKLKTRVKEIFSDMFCDNDTQFEEYIDIIMKWYAKTGNNIPKLSKAWMQLSLALNILSNKIQDLDLTDRIEALCNPNLTDSDRLRLLNLLRDVKKNSRREIFRQAISRFTVSVFDIHSYYKLKELWCEARSKLSTYDFNKIIHHYGLKSENISDVSQIDPRTASQLLWLKESDCPLIVSEDPAVYKAIKLCPDKIFVLLGEGSLIEDTNIFRSLADLQKETDIYKRIMDNFSCSIQGKKEIRFSDLLTTSNTSQLEAIKADDLLEMLDAPYKIGGSLEQFTYTYEGRILYQNLTSLEFLKNNENMDALIIVDFVGKDIKKLKNILPTYTFNDVEEIYLTKAPPSINDFRSVIFFSAEKCTYSQFRVICRKINARYYHQFRFLDMNGLRWIRSQGEETFDLSSFELLDDPYKTREDALWLQPENNVNIVIGDQNAGKTELMKKLKNNCPSRFWTVILSSDDTKAFLTYIKENIKGQNLTRNTSLSEFDRFLLEKLAHLNNTDKMFLQLFMEQHKVICVWDEIDKLSKFELEEITKIILDLSKLRTQWISSRCILKNYLEDRFKVFSLKLENDLPGQTF